MWLNHDEENGKSFFAHVELKIYVLNPGSE